MAVKVRGFCEKRIWGRNNWLPLPEPSPRGFISESPAIVRNEPHQCASIYNKGKYRVDQMSGCDPCITYNPETLLWYQLILLYF